jgi:hypothetical protein
MNNNSNNIFFKITQDKNKQCCDIDIYRIHTAENGNNTKEYVNTINTISMFELWKLQIFLQEYLYQADWDE